MSMFDDRGNIRTGRAWFYGLSCSFLLLVVLPIALWAFGVFTSGVRGAGDVIRQNNSANNRVAAQNEFNRLWGNIQAYHDDIAAQAAIVASDLKSNVDPTDDRDTLKAQQQICRSAVQTYDADTLDMTMADWRPAADPSNIDSRQECEVSP